MVNPLFQLYVFDVWLWQSIFFRPIGSEHYNLMVDVWHDSVNDKHPIDFIISQKLLPIDGEWYYYIWDLTITNYDHDHYSGLPHLRTKSKILTTKLISSVQHDVLYENKPEKTSALQHLIDIKKTYTSGIDTQTWNPPYKKYTKYLYPTDNWKWDFNNLSQIVFIEYWNFTICIPWDLEQEWWKYMLLDPEVTSRLEKTHIFFASHHGRENWYMKEVFDHCKPILVVISDKEIVHSTQEKSADIYRKHVVWEGLSFYDQSTRKVLSTRNDGSFVFTGFDELKYSIQKISF